MAIITMQDTPTWEFWKQIIISKRCSYYNIQLFAYLKLYSFSNVEIELSVQIYFVLLSLFLFNIHAHKIYFAQVH